MARIEDDLLTNLKSGKSVFRFIPDNIGEIVYCDSDNPKAEPDTKELTQKKIALSVVIPIVIVVFCWLVFNESPIFDSIVTVVMLIIMFLCIRMCLSFDGLDYFVGTEGASIVHFDKTRNNISSQNIWLFRDFEDLLLSEVKRYKNRTYLRTDYQFVVYGHEKDNKKQVIVNKNGSYNQEKPDSYYTDRVFRFWKKVESFWSDYKLSQIKVALNNGDVIGFNVYFDDKFANDYIVFKEKEISIGGKTYNKNNIKNIGFKNGELIIEDVNHSTKFFGLIEKGDKVVLPLHCIGNRELFLKFFQYFASTL